MPLNGSGGVTQPTSSLYPAVASTLIESAKANASIADIYTILASAIYKDGQQTTTARIPFASGISSDSVTEKTSDTGVTLDSVLLKDGRIDTTQGADITAAATTNLETATGNVIDVTGNTGITAITLAQGHWRLVRFTGTPAITHGASLVLPGAANITAAAGDYALFVGYASSVVRCAGYWRAANLPVIQGATTSSGLMMTTARLLGRTTAATGAIEEMSVGASLTLSAGSLSGTAASTTQAGVVELLTQAEYDAGTDTTRAPTASLNKLTLGTPTVTTSGTTIDVTGIPAGTRRITINFVGVSTNGATALLVQIGDSGGIETAGYTAAAININSATTQADTTGFVITQNFVAAQAYHGRVTLELENASAFTWVATAIGHLTGTASYVASGSKATSAELDRVRLTTVGGDTFDAGEINVIYER